MTAGDSALFGRHGPLAPPLTGRRAVPIVCGNRAGAAGHCSCPTSCRAAAAPAIRNAGIAIPFARWPSGQPAPGRTANDAHGACRRA